jgi:adenosylcobinamide-GDP ribazoletransferase
VTPPAGPARPWRRELGHLHSALSFLTPLGRSQARPSPAAMTYFPIVGAALGAALGALGLGARRALGPLPAAAVVVAADAVLTGALHLDGLADSADGLLAHVPTKHRLDIMSAPDLGAFGAVALSVDMIVRTAALSALEPSPSLMACHYGAARALMVLGSRVMPYARPEGLAAAFLNTGAPGDGRAGPRGVDRASMAALAALAASVVWAWHTNGRRGAASVTCGVVAGVAVLGLGQRRLGGFTGDVLGAAGAVCEAVGLLAGATGHGADGSAPMTGLGARA